MKTATITTLATNSERFNPDEASRWIGTGNIRAISGGRRILDVTSGALFLPIRYGYSVRVTLDAGSDTYTVERTHKGRNGLTVKGVQTYVHCAELGEACYRASCYSDPFGEV